MNLIYFQACVCLLFWSLQIKGASVAEEKSENLLGQIDPKMILAGLKEMSKKDLSEEFLLDQFRTLLKLSPFNLPIYDSSKGSLSIDQLVELETTDRLITTFSGNTKYPPSLLFGHSKSFIPASSPLVAHCHNFVHGKTSIDPASFTKTEKHNFIDEASHLGLFSNFSVSSKKSGGSKANQQPVSEAEAAKQTELQDKVIIAAGSIPCQAALKIVAGLLKSDELAWLLKHLPEVVVAQPEVLLQLTDFSKFTATHVTSAARLHFSWFKCPEALKTLPAASLFALLEFLNFSIALDDLRALNAVRPLETLFQHPAFNSAHLWQLVAGFPEFWGFKLYNGQEIVGYLDSFENVENLDRLFLQVVAHYFHTDASIGASLVQLAQSCIMINFPPVMVPMPPVSNALPAADSIPSDTDPISGQTAFPSPPPVISTPPPSYFYERFDEHLNVVICQMAERKTLQMALEDLADRLPIREKIQSLLDLLETPMNVLSRLALSKMSEVSIKEKTEEENDMSVEAVLRCFNSFDSVGNVNALARLFLTIIQYYPDNDVFPYSTASASKALNTLEFLTERVDPVCSQQALVLDSKWMCHIINHQLNEVVYGIHQAALDYSAVKENITERLTRLPRSHFSPIILENLKRIMDFLEHMKSMQASTPQMFAVTMTGFEAAHFEGLKSALEKLELYALPCSVESLELQAEELLSKISRASEMLAITTEAPSYFKAYNADRAQLEGLMGNVFGATSIASSISLISGNGKLLKAFLEFPSLLNRSQIASLLSNEEGRSFFIQNPEALHSLATYEDFRAVDVKSLGLSLQYAKNPHTAPVVVQMPSLARDGYLVNSPSSFAALLNDHTWEANSFANSAWKFLNIQTVLTTSQKFSIQSPWFKRIVEVMPTIQGARMTPTSQLMTILQWKIMMEVHYLEAHINIQFENSLLAKTQMGLPFLAYMENAELSLVSTWTASNHPKLLESFDAAFMARFSNIIRSPLSQLRAGLVALSDQLIPANQRTLDYIKTPLNVFSDWSGKLKNQKNAFGALQPGMTEIGMVRDLIDPIVKIQIANWKYLYERLADALGTSQTERSLWLGRMKLISLYSADGITFDSSFTYGEAMNLLKTNSIPVHERILLLRALLLAQFDVAAVQDPVAAENQSLADLWPENAAILEKVATAVFQVKVVKVESEAAKTVATDKSKKSTKKK